MVEAVVLGVIGGSAIGALVWSVHRSHKLISGINNDLNTSLKLLETVRDSLAEKCARLEAENAETKARLNNAGDLLSAARAESFELAEEVDKLRETALEAAELKGKLSAYQADRESTIQTPPPKSRKLRTTDGRQFLADELEAL